MPMYQDGSGEQVKDTQHCAGVLFITPDRKFLLLHRTDRDEWEGPGGHVQDGEAILDAALRESFEEVGPHGYSEIVTVRDFLIEPDGVYSLHVIPSNEFTPTLSDEHDAFQWAATWKLPETTHPNTKAFVSDLLGTEEGIARSMVQGILPSPQRLDRSWLFDIRATGTGLSYRTKGDGEWCYRPPEFYLGPETLSRWNGVPVLFGHVEKSLDTEEWRQRAIGSIVMPYVPEKDDEKHRTDEVWSIARIFDEDAAELMMTTHTSTSPDVQFEGPLKYILAEDGKRLLIEGKPSLIDNIAVCEAGVWDKGGEPRGVNN